MPFPLLAQLFTDDLTETVEALAASLRSTSPHMAEMVHAQVLSDCTVICESLWALLQEPAKAVQGQMLFTEYLDRRRKVGFSEVELLGLVAESQLILKKLLKGGSTGDDLKEAYIQLDQGFTSLENIISSTTGTVAG